jgi:hypothetical protein
MLAQFIRLAVDDASDARELEESLEQEGARVWLHGRRCRCCGRNRT